MKRKITDEESREIWKMFKDGETTKEIARCFGVTTQSVSKHIRSWEEKTKSEQERRALQRFKDAANLCETCQFALGDIAGRYKCEKTGKSNTKVIACLNYALQDILPWDRRTDEWLLQQPWWKVEYTAKMVWKQYFKDSKNEKWKKVLMEEMIKKWWKDNPYTFLNMLNEARTCPRARKVLKSD